MADKIVKIRPDMSSSMQNMSSGEPPMDTTTERLKAIETILPTLATKESVVMLKSEMHQEFNAFTWRFIGISMTAAIFIIGSMITLFNMNKSRPLVEDIKALQEYQKLLYPAPTAVPPQASTTIPPSHK